MLLQKQVRYKLSRPGVRRLAAWPVYTDQLVARITLVNWLLGEKVFLVDTANFFHEVNFFRKLISPLAAPCLTIKREGDGDYWKIEFSVNHR